MRFRPALGEPCAVGGVLALFSTDRGEALDQPVTRGVRFATAGIIYHSGM